MMDRTCSPLVVRTNRVLAGSLLGAQLAWAATIVPSTRRLSAAEYAKVHSLLTWYADALMPALGGATTLTALLRYRRSPSLAPLAGSLALGVASVAAASNLRINARLRAAWAKERLDEAERREVLRERDRWLVRHLVRTAGGAAAVLASAADEREGRTVRPGGVVHRAGVDVLAGLVALQVGRDVVRHLTMMAGRGPDSGMRALVLAARPD